MVYNKNPHYLSRDAIEYGYYPQKEANITIESVKEESELLLEGAPTGAFFFEDRFLFSYGGKYYEYLPIRWRIFDRKDGLLHLVSEDILGVDSYYGMKEFLEKGFRRTALFLDEGHLEAINFKKVRSPSYADCLKMLVHDREKHGEAPLLVARYPLAIFPEDYQGEEGEPMPFWVDDPLASSFAQCYLPLQKPSPLQRRKNCFEMLGIRACIAIKEAGVEKAAHPEGPIPEKDDPRNEAIRNEFLLLAKDWKTRSKFLAKHSQDMSPSFLEEALRATLPLFGEGDYRLIGAYALYASLRFSISLSHEATKALAQEFAPLRKGENMEHELGESEEKTIGKTVAIFRERMAGAPSFEGKAGLEERLQRLLRYIASQPDRHFHDRRGWVKEEQDFALEAFAEVFLNVQ